MDLFLGLLKLISLFVSVYSFLCLIYLLLRLSPSLHQTSFYNLLGNLCEPYLNLFRNLKFFRFQNLDFSPILSLGVLYLLSNMLNTIIAMKRFSLGVILSVFVSFAYSIVNSLLVFIIILIIIRLIFLMLNKDSSTIWFSFDQFIKPIADFFTKRLYKNSFYTFQKSLIISLIALILLSLAFRIIMIFFIGILQSLPI